MEYLKSKPDEEINDVSIIFNDIIIKKETKNSFELLEKHDGILEAISYIAEKFLKTTGFSSGIYDVFDKIGKAVYLNKIYLIECEAVSDNQVFMQKSYLWNSGNRIGTIITEEYMDMTFSSNKIERWYKRFKNGKYMAGLISSLPAIERSIVFLRGAKSFLMVPVIVKNSFWGFLCFVDKKNEREWTNTEINALKAIAKIISAEIQRIDSDSKLLKAKEDAERANLLKTQFLAQMSHEIRTPLNSILSFISLLKNEIEGNNSEFVKSWFGMIDSSSKRLIRTIDMILTMSQLQAGNYEYSPSEVDMAADFISDIYKEFIVFANERRLDYTFEKKIEKALVLVDAHTVSHIILNLIENAMKFTKKGKVEIVLYENQSGEICIDVCDTGIGISEEYFPDLFTPFSQEDMGIRRSFEGNGLGLALVKKYADMNNAVIQVKSKKSIGSTFTVIFKKNYEKEE